MPIWKPIRLASVDSTNRYAADAARAGEPEGLVVVADVQESGRGRLGRSWLAPAGSSLLCSLLLRPQLSVDDLHLVTAALALAARSAAEEQADVKVMLKWPNDLLVGERKVAGILAEVVEGPNGGGRALVVGIGVNCHWPEGFGDGDEEAMLLERATTLADAGHDPGAEVLLDALLAHFGPRYDALASPAGRRATVDAYRAALSTIGKMVRVVEPTDEWEGFAATIDQAGRLVVRRGGEMRALNAADVIHLRT